MTTPSSHSRLWLRPTIILSTVWLLLLCGPAAAQEEEEGSAADFAGGAVDEDASTPEEEEPAKAESTVDSQQTREDEMFGGGGDEDRDADIFGDEGAGDQGDGPGLRELEPIDVDAMESRLLAADDPMAIGGRMYLRLDYQALDEGDLHEFPLGSPNLVDVYLDTRPNDRLRGFVKGRLRFQPTADTQEPDVLGNTAKKTSMELDQLWLNFDIGRVVFVTAGRQRIKWGAGRFWNPTDFLNQQRLDPLAVFDERLGADLLKVHLPIESLGWNLYAVANVADATTPEEVGGAVRAEILADLTEIAVTAAARRDAPYGLGLDVSTALWVFDLHGEVAASYNVQTPRYEEKEWEPSTPTGQVTLPEIEVPTEDDFLETIDRSGDWIVQAVAGAEIEIGYGDDDSFFLGSEYFYNDAGYESADIYPWLLLKQAYTPLYLGRHYASTYLMFPSPGSWNDWTFTVSGIGNLSDRSVIARGDIRVRALTYLDVNAYATTHLGEEGELRFGLEVPPVPGVEGLEEGIDLAPQLFDVGVGLTLSM